MATAGSMDATETYRVFAQAFSKEAPISSDFSEEIFHALKDLEFMDTAAFSFPNVTVPHEPVTVVFPTSNLSPKPEEASAPMEL
ncbi:hypothetical protein HDU67_004211, partial [Dinochytrium kinnereticum]